MFLDDFQCPVPPQTSPMVDFYKNKNIFLTGGTGSVGQLIMAKLLSLDIQQLTILVRPKTGLSAMERIANILENPIFNRLRQTNNTFSAKLNILEGQLGEKNLGLSERDIDCVIRNTHIVFHVAADINFEQTLTRAILNNVRSVYDLLQMAEKMKKLESFLYMSTAYSNNVAFIEEKVYKKPLEPEILIELAELRNGDDTEMAVLTDIIIKPWRNTYTYTKNLAELLVMKYGSRFPAAIIRPSIIVATDKDPIPGYFDNGWGVNGVSVGYALGISRVMWGNPEYTAEIIPCDYVSNATLGVAWYTGCEWKKKIGHKQQSIEDGLNDVKIYNCVTSLDNPVTWDDLRKDLMPYYHEYPTSKILWYMTNTSTTNYYVFKLYTLFYHCVPAYFIDKMLAWKGKELRLMNNYRLIYRCMVHFSLFHKNWKFSNRNMRMIYDKMNADDRKYFPCDVKHIDWLTYFSNYALGLRVYFLNDPLTTLEGARARLFKLRMAHYFVLFFYYGFILLVGFGLLRWFNTQEYIDYARNIVVFLYGR